MANLEIIAATCGLAVIMTVAVVIKSVVRRHRRRKLKAELEIRRAALRLAYALEREGVDHKTIYMELFSYGKAVFSEGYSVAVCKQQMKNFLLNALQLRA